MLDNKKVSEITNLIHSKKISVKEVVEYYLKRIEKYNFRITINKPIYFAKDDSLEQITEKLNYILEKMVLKNPEQWILTHNRWKL